MEFEDFIKALNEMEQKVDEVLKAARLQRTPKQPMDKEKLSMILSYVLGGVGMAMGFVLVLVFMWFTH